MQSIKNALLNGTFNKLFIYLFSSYNGQYIKCRRFGICVLCYKINFLYVFLARTPTHIFLSKIFFLSE